MDDLLLQDHIFTAIVAFLSALIGGFFTLLGVVASNYLAKKAQIEQEQRRDVVEQFSGAVKGKYLLINIVNSYYSIDKSLKKWLQADPSDPHGSTEPGMLLKPIHGIYKLSDRISSDHLRFLYERKEYETVPDVFLTEVRYQALTDSIAEFNALRIKLSDFMLEHGNPGYLDDGEPVSGFDSDVKAKIDLRLISLNQIATSIVTTVGEDYKNSKCIIKRYVSAAREHFDIEKFPNIEIRDY